MRTLLLVSAVEIRRRLRQWALYGIVIGLVVLAWFSVAIGASDLVARRETYAKQLADLAREQVRSRVPLLGWAPEPVLRAIRAPELGSLVARGDDLSVPAYFDFGPAGTIWARSVPSDATQLRTGTLPDLESIIRVLGGFLAVLLGVEAITSARASGLVRAWDALGARPVPVTLGKLLGSWVVMGAASSVVFGAATVSAVLRLPDEGRDVLAVFVRCLAPTVLYLGCFIGVGAAVAVWFKHQTTAFVGGIALWITAAMIWPQVVAFGARVQSPHELRGTMEAQRDQAFADEIRAGENALGDAVADWIGQARADTSARAIETHRTELDSLWLAHARAARSAADAVEETWRRGQQRQAAFDRLGGVFSPGTPFLLSMTAVSGTGDELSGRWLAAVDSQQRRLSQILFDDRARITVRAPSQNGRQLLGLDRRPGPRWPELPAFQAPVMTSAELWWSATGPLTALLGYLGLAVLAAAIGARRLRL